MMCDSPPPVITASELACIELSRSVDHLVSLAPRLSAADMEFIRKENRRLDDLLFEAVFPRKGA